MLCHSTGALKDSGLYQASGLTPLCTTFTSYKTAVEERKPLPVPLRVLCVRGWGITGIFAILQYFLQCQGYRLLQEADVIARDIDGNLRGNRKLQDSVWPHLT